MQSSISTPVPSVVRDPSRLAALRRTALLDTPAEESFDRLARLASQLLHAPVVLVSLVDEDRQFFKSCIGLAEPWASRRETPLSHSFCQYVVEAREPFVVEDARRDPRVRHNLAIPDLGVIAYLGVPLITSEGYELGTLCAIDNVPRAWTQEEIRTLRDLAASVLMEIELRCTMHQMREEMQVNRLLAAREAHAGPAPRDPKKWARDGVRLARLHSLAQRASEKLGAGKASLVDLVMNPRDMLWLTGKLTEARREELSAISYQSTNLGADIPFGWRPRVQPAGTDSR
jgi:hypothetical protein